MEPAGGRGDEAPREPWRNPGWAEAVGTREQAGAPGDRGRERAAPNVASSGTARVRRAPEPVAEELRRAVGTRRIGRYESGLMEASRAFERERFGDAAKILRTLRDEAPDVPSVRELLGLSLYRQERWALAVRELERFAELSGSVEQHPVLADAHRALGHHDRVRELWEELASASPSAALVAEGRIVLAGSLADQRRVPEAIAILERAAAPTKRPREHHLRLWYALADLYERAGDIPRARDLFHRVLAADEGFADVAERVAGLG